MIGQPHKEIPIGRAAIMLHTSVDTVRRLIEEGQIEAYRLHDTGWWHISHSSVLALVERIKTKFALEEKSVRGAQRLKEQDAEPSRRPKVLSGQKRNSEA